FIALSGAVAASDLLAGYRTKTIERRDTRKITGGVLMSVTNTRGVNRLRFLSALAGSTAFPYLFRAESTRAAGLSGKITMIKGPHSADEAKYEAEIIDDFKKANP